MGFSLEGCWVQPESSKGDRGTRWESDWGRWDVKARSWESRWVPGKGKEFNWEGCRVQPENSETERGTRWESPWVPRDEVGRSWVTRWVLGPNVEFCWVRTEWSPPGVAHLGVKIKTKINPPRVALLGVDIRIKINGGIKVSVGTATLDSLGHGGPRLV